MWGEYCDGLFIFVAGYSRLTALPRMGTLARANDYFFSSGFDKVPKSTVVSAAKYANAAYAATC
jgi:hypothetical protein